MIYIDESGRGCCSGDMILVGVKLNSEDGKEFSHLKYYKDIKDSKKLSKPKLMKIAQELIDNNIDYHLVSFSPQLIDTIGLSRCLKSGLIDLKSHFGNEDYLYDGNCNYGVDNIKTEVKADAKYFGVSCASILAKFAKENESKELDTIYPKYGFGSHSGYVTKKHKEAIKEYGLIEGVHRMSYNLNLD